MRKPNIFDYLLLILLALIWASAFFNIKIATYSFGPVTIAFLRVFFGAIPVLLLCYYKKIKIEAFSKDWHWFASIGFINLVAPFFLTTNFFLGTFFLALPPTVFLGMVVCYL